MSDYSFLRTGLADADIPEPPEVVLERTKRLMSVTVALMTRAAETAATYAEHSGRKAATHHDVVVGLQYQTKYFFEQVTDEEVVEARKDVDAAFDASSTEEEEEEEEEEEKTRGVEVEVEVDFDVGEEEEEEEEWTRSECSCAICRTVNTTVDTCDEWEPDDEVLQHLKHMTNKYMESRCNKINF